MEGDTDAEKDRKIKDIILEELLADAYSGINSNQWGATNFTDIVNAYMDEHYIGKQTETKAEAERGPPADLETDRYSTDAEKEKELSEIAEQFAKDIDEWDEEGRSNEGSFVIGSTGNVLQGLGAIESDIYINAEKINQIMSDHPEMTLDDIKKIPAIVKDPVLIVKSQNKNRGNAQNTRLIIFGNEKAENKKPILAVYDLRPIENHFVIEDMQKLTSAYTKTISPEEFIRNSEIMYADKKRTTNLLKSIGFKTPIELRHSGFIGSIAYQKRNINLTGEKFSDVFTERSVQNGRDSFSVDDVTDAEYLQAVMDGDTETAQEMVQEVGEAAGGICATIHWRNVEKVGKYENNHHTE